MVEIGKEKKKPVKDLILESFLDSVNIETTGAFKILFKRIILRKGKYVYIPSKNRIK